MNLYSIRVISDASLFCPQPCVLATFYLDSPDINLFSQHGEAVRQRAVSELSKIGIDSAFQPCMTESSLPEFIAVANSLVEEVMRKLELYCEPACTTQDDNGNRLFVAFAEKDRWLTMNVVSFVLGYVMSLYSQDKTADTSHFLPNLQHLLDRAENLGKSRPTKEMQRCLMAGSRPWLSLDYDRHSKDWLQLGFGRQQKILDGTVSFDSFFIGVTTSISKIKSQQFMAQLGFPVPRQVIVQSAEHASQVASELGFPVVLKSDVGAFGDRVYADLRSSEEVAEVFHIITRDFKRNSENHVIFLESFVQGKVYRVEVVNGKFFDAFEMIPAGVTGDGEHTVKELVAIENQQANRGASSDVSCKYISLQLGTAELLMLTKQNMTLESIPDSGQEIRLRANSNWSCGGTFKKVSELVHPDNQLLAERIAAAFKIDLFGIDLITHNIAKSFVDENLEVIEVNHSPDILGYFDDITGKFVDVGSRIINRMLPDAVYGDVPVIIFKATELANVSEVLFATILNKLGYSAGLINQQGLVIDGHFCAKPERVDYENPGLQLLRNNTVGAAIIDRRAEELVNFGLGSAGCDIAVVLDCKNTDIVTPVWPYGIHSKKSDNFLSQSARLMSIIYVNDADSIELCQQCQPEKLFALFLLVDSELDQFLDPGANSVKLLQHTKDGVMLRIVFQKHSFEKWLNLPGIDNVLPYLVALAMLLVLDCDVEKIWPLLESEI